MIKNKSSFIMMIFAVVGVVLWCTMFLSVMEGFDSLGDYANLSTFTVMSTVVSIAPTILLIAGIFGAGFAFYKGYQGASAQDASGMLRMVFGIVIIILFVTLFETILTNMYYLYDGGTSTNASFTPSDYTAWTTVVGIAPVILFIGGIFGGAMTAVSGYRARRSRRSKLLS